LVAVSSFGILRFHHEKNPMKLWIPRNSDFIKDTNWLTNQFREGYRIQSILITAPNVLEPQVLQKVGIMPGYSRTPRLYFFFHQLYDPLWVLSFLDKSFQAFLSIANSFQFLTFSTFRSSHTSSNHLNLGLPSGRFPIGFLSNILFAIL
jgi:hypothetical protein